MPAASRSTTGPAPGCATGSGSTKAFYDASKVAIVPMGSCFPGQDAKGGDLGPRRECAEAWRQPLRGASQSRSRPADRPYAQAWHLRDGFEDGLTETVRRWRTSSAIRRSPHPAAAASVLAQQRLA